MMTLQQVMDMCKLSLCMIVSARANFLIQRITFASMYIFQQLSATALFWSGGNIRCQFVAFIRHANPPSCPTGSPNFKSDALYCDVMRNYLLANCDFCSNIFFLNCLCGQIGLLVYMFLKSLYMTLKSGSHFLHSVRRVLHCRYCTVGCFNCTRLKHGAGKPAALSLTEED